MIKVLRIINRFNLGGPTYNVAYLTKYLSDEYETLLVGGTEDETEASSDFIVNNLGLKPLIIPEMRREINFKNDVATYKKLKKIIQEYKPDIVHTHASKAGTLGRLAASACNVPVIVFYKNIERYLARKSSAIIAISEKQKHELVDIYKITNANKVHVVPLGFDLSKFQENSIEKRNLFRSQYNLDDDEIAITIVGRLVPVKNHALFLEGLKIVSEKTSKKIRAFIVGDGESRKEIENKATELNISFSTENQTDVKNLLTFTSWIKEIDEVLAGSDIVALTSFNEGTPVSLIEAQAANKPIITTNVGGIENVVLVNETALLCENNDLTDFSNKLLKIIEDESLRKSMSEKGWLHVKEKYHFTRLASDMQKLYEKLLNAKKRQN